jgi:hypothetical protein
MNPILSGTEAFNAMAAGQKIECRHAESNLDFDDIRNFPATVFIDQDFEFRIAVIYMTIGSMQVPESIIECPSKGTPCYTPSILTAELSKAFKWKNSDADLSLLSRGLVHLYEENAITHANALIAVSRGSIEAQVSKVSEDLLPWEQDNQNSASKKVEGNTASLIDDVAAPTETKPAPVSRTAFSIEDVAEIKTDPVQIIEEFAAKIDACTSTEAVLGLRPVFFANGHLEREDQQHLCRLTEAKLLELDPEQYTSDPEPENLSVENLQRLQKEAEKLVAENKLADVAELEYQKLLDDLLQRAANAALPAEATALTGYTKTWSETQRKPLLDAIHKRLNELNPPERAEAKEPPSLLVQIQNAKDLTELDCLEIEVSSRHVDIQPKLMGYVKRRRAELESQGSEVAS